MRQRLSSMPADRRSRRPSRLGGPRAGFTLAEMMIAVTLMLFIFAMVVPFLRTQMHELGQNAGNLDALQNARFSQNAIDRELRVAGAGVVPGRSVRQGTQSAPLPSRGRGADRAAAGYLGHRAEQVSAPLARRVLPSRQRPPSRPRGRANSPSRDRRAATRPDRRPDRFHRPECGSPRLPCLRQHNSPASPA